MATELDLAYAHCQRITRREAKNFYYAFRTLPAPRRKAIYAAYAFCRLCDDIADEDFPLEEKRTRLQETRRLLQMARDGHAQGPIFTALRDAMTAFHIPGQYFEEIIDGVEMDLVKDRYRTFQELREYCYKVASAVGLVCIEVFGYSDPRAQEYAVDLGIAMQLTNILRDVKEDAQRGRIYIPLEEMEAHRYTEEELMAGVMNDAARSLLRFQVRRAREYFERGRRLFPLLSPRSRACPAVLAAVYSGILDRIEAADYDVFQRRIGLSRMEKLLLMARLWAASLLATAPLPRR